MQKETAVEWLISQILKEKVLLDLDIDQAKELEKQQIMDAYEIGYSSGYRDIGKSGEQYYNETYKSK